MAAVQESGFVVLAAGASATVARRLAKEAQMRVVMVIVLVAVTTTLAAAQASGVRLPAETAGREQVARTLVAAFDQVDVVALGEDHGQQRDSDLRIAIVRHPDFARKVRAIVVEFGSTTEQATLDRYIRGETVPRAQLEQVWKTTTRAHFGELDSRFFIDFFNTVREVNAHLPAASRIRVFGGDPGPTDTRSRQTAAVSVLKEQVLQKHEKALVIYGAAHFYRVAPADYLAGMGQDVGIARMLEAAYPGRTLVVIPVGGRMELPPGITMPAPSYAKFDRAIATPQRPVLLSLQRSPFRDLKAEEFLGGKLLTCGGSGGCRSVFMGSPLTLGPIADACVYFGSGE